MARRRIGAGGPFLVAPSRGDFTTTVEKRPVVVVSVQANVRSTLKYRLKTEIQLGKVFGKKSIFPAPIWVTLAGTKRVVIQKRTIARLALGEPTVTTVVTVTKSKATKIVSLVEFRRARPKTNVKFIPKFGKATTRVKVVGPQVIGDVSKQRQPIRGKVALKQPTKVVAVVVQRAKRQLLILLNKTARKRHKTKFGFTKTFGKATSKVNPKKAQYLKFAALQAERKARYVPVKIKLGKVPRLFTPAPPPPNTNRNSGMLAAKHVRRLMRKR